MTPVHSGGMIAALAACVVGAGVGSAEAIEQWVLGSFAIVAEAARPDRIAGGLLQGPGSAMDSRWTDEAKLGSCEQCMDLVRTAVDSDAGTLRFAGVAVAQTVNTVTGWDPRTKRTIASTVYLCRGDGPRGR